jgi:hypothetical protein
VLGSLAKSFPLKELNYKSDLQPFRACCGDCRAFTYLFFRLNPLRVSQGDSTKTIVTSCAGFHAITLLQRNVYA